MFFKVNKEDNTFKTLSGEYVGTCGIANCFHLGDSSGRMIVDLYIADKSFKYFVCHKSIFTLDIQNYKNSKESIKIEEMDYSIANIDIKDIPMKYNVEIEKTCKACCATQKKYNKTDRILSCYLYPLYEPNDVMDIYSCKEMHSAQAIILILKTIMNEDDDLYNKIRKINSKTINPTKLHEILYNEKNNIDTFVNTFF